MNTQPEVLDKMRQFLCLSNCPNQHATELGLQKAQEIDIRNQFDLTRRHVPDEHQSLQKVEKVEVRYRRGTTTRLINLLLQNHFTVLIAYRQGTDMAYYVGRTAQIEIARLLYAFLDAAWHRQWNALKAAKRVGACYRATHFYRFYRGIDAKLVGNRRRVEMEIIEEIRVKEGHEKADIAAAEYATAVRNATDELQQAVASFFPNVGHRGLKNGVIGQGKPTEAKSNTDAASDNSSPLEPMSNHASIQ